MDDKKIRDFLTSIKNTGGVLNGRNRIYMDGW